MKINNLKVYDLEESIIASGYPMRVDLSGDGKATDKDVARCLNLTKASNGNGAHGQWLTGVRVAFDLTCTNKMWVEAERYRFLEFVSSQSTMHRITKFDVSESCNEYVDSRVKAVLKEKIDKYNDLVNKESTGVVNDEKYREEKKKAYLKVLYNVPSGFELTARVTTNYRCLLNIYVQRHDHRLPEWREFCEQLLTLPLFKQIVEAYYSKENVEKTNG